VEAESEGVVKLRPLPTGLPPEGAVYQNTGSEELAWSERLPGPQRESPVVAGTVATELIVAVTPTRGLTQPAELASA
jgi:hypothetical protein